MIEAQISDSRSRVDIAYMHRNLTIVGLPIRRPAPHAGNTAEFHRKGPGFDLTLLTQDARIQDGEIDTVVPIGVPWGTKPRLLIMWLASALQKNPHQRFVEIGPIKEWLASIGVPATGEAHDSTKAQTVKLCHTIFTVSVNGIDQDGDKAVGRIATSLVEESIFKHEDLLHFKAGRYGDIKWPTGLMLTERAAMQFDQQLIPIPVKYLREIANNATAIDLFLYLSYRLPLIPEGKTQLISWKQLSLQSGHHHRCVLPNSEKISRARSMLRSRRIQPPG